MSEPTVIASAPQASPTAAVLRRIEGLSAQALGGAAAIAVALPLLATMLAGPLGDVLLVAMALASAVGGVAAIRHRNRIASLPFEISEVALVGSRGSSRTYRFRARLGLGRRLRHVDAEVVAEGPDGRLLRLDTARLPAVVGPFTVLAVDPTPGAAPHALVVRVSGREGGRRWEAHRRFAPAELRPGRFDAGVVRRRGRIELTPTWDAVVPEEPSALSPPARSQVG